LPIAVAVLGAPAAADRTTGEELGQDEESIGQINLRVAIGVAATLNYGATHFAFPRLGLGG